MKIKFLAIGLLGLAMACSENEFSKTTQNPAFTLNAVQQRALAVYDEQHVMKNTAGRVILGNPADLQSQLGDTPIDIPANKTQKFVSIDPQYHYEDFQLSRVLNTGENLKVIVSGTNYITIG
jgi:ABC-type Fe3+-hydroxamate transport system substrate-binding protein